MCLHLRLTLRAAVAVIDRRLFESDAALEAGRLVAGAGDQHEAHAAHSPPSRAAGSGRGRLLASLSRSCRKL